MVEVVSWHGHACCLWNKLSHLYWWLNLWWEKQNEFGRVQNHIAYQYLRNCHQDYWDMLHIASGQWPKTPYQFSQGVYKGKEMESLRLPESISRFKSDWAWISPAEEESKGRNSPKQATIGIGCIKGWEKYFKEWDQGVTDYGSQTHCCDCAQVICN